MKNLRSFLPLASIVVVLLFCSNASSEECYLYFYGEAARMFGSKPRGPYSESACENYRRNAPRLEKNNSECKCTKSSSGSSGPSGGLGPSQQMAVGLFGALLNNLMQQALAPAPSSLSSTKQKYRVEESPQEKLKREQEQKQRLEEFKAKIKEQIASNEENYRRLKSEEFEKQRELVASDLRARYGATFGNKGKTGTALRELQQLQCSSYWALKAADMTAKGDTKLARLYEEYSAKAEKGTLTNCPNTKYNIPDVSAPKPYGETYGLQQEYQKFILEQTQQITPVIGDLTDRHKASQKNITSKQAEIETVKKKQDTADDTEKQEIDNRLQEENKLLAELLEADKKVTDELNVAQNKLKALQEMGNVYAAEENPKKQEAK